MKEILQILREPIPEAIGGIVVAIVLGLTSLVASIIWKRRMRYDIYLSYPVADRPMIEQLVARLESLGVKVFFDRKIKVGEKFQKRLDAA